MFRHRAARLVVLTTFGLTLFGCQQGTELNALASQPAPAPTTQLVASAPAPVPEVVAPADFSVVTTTTSTTTTVPPTTTAPPPPTTAPPPPAPAPDPEPAPPPAPKQKVRVASVAPAAPAPAPPAAPPLDNAAASDFTSRTNGLRRSVGLPALARDGSLDALAAGWARELASSGQLRHSTIPKSIVGNPWGTVGENVGYGSSVASVHDALVASPAHYANLTGAAFTRVGIGVATDGAGNLWVTELFAG